jgi:hypothetical protein
MTAEQIAKGDILCSEFFLYKNSITGEATAADAASIVASTEFMKNSSYRDLMENQTYLISVGLQIDL